MNLLSAGLGYHRALARAGMPDTATRLRPVVQAGDGQGGVTAGALDQTVTFVCRLYGQSKSPMERPQGGRVVAVMQWQLACPVGTDLKPTDQIQISGRVFEVTDLDEKRSSPAVLWVNLKEVR